MGGARAARKSRWMILGIATVAAGTLVAFLVFHDPKAGLEGAAASDPFARKARASDRLPGWLADRVIASRRIGVYARADQAAALYLARMSDKRGLCLILVSKGAAGGSCSPRLLAGGQAITVMYGLHYASGRVRSDVRSVVVVGTRGRHHRVEVHAGGGFIYRCPAFAGCTASVRSIEAYSDHGRFLGSDALPG
jgi:hypothetical protein